MASDFAAFLDHTKDGVILEDDQVVVVTPERLDVTDLDGNPVEAYEHHVDWDLSAAEKGGYEHFMLKEMHEQPLAIKQTLEGRTDPAGRLALDELRMSEDELRDVDKVFVVACGTAYHSGLVAKYAIEPDPAAGGDRDRQRVPLPGPRAGPQHPGHRHLPVGGDGRHPGAVRYARRQRPGC